MLINWVLEKLEMLQDESMLLVRDGLRLLPEADGAVHRFANDHGFTVIVASTNLAFRELFENASNAEETRKLLIMDRAPARRRGHTSVTKAPPPFYPDLLSRTPADARIEVNLRHFLIEQTGDPNWPQKANDPRFARLINDCLGNILRAHDNLRAAHPGRFTDHDFQVIVAFSALGVPDAAFKRLQARSYWRIGLLGHQVLEELDSIAPEVARSIRDELGKAPRPFCWFADQPSDIVLRAFYLSTILAQHTTHWNLLLANIDPDLKPFSDIEIDLLQEAAPELVSLDPERAHRDLLEIESSVSRDALHLILLDQMNIIEAPQFVQAIKQERYSTLIRSLALLVALEDLISERSPREVHQQVWDLLSPVGDEQSEAFVEGRPSTTWTHLKEAYELAWEIRNIKGELAVSVKNLKVSKASDLSFERFRSVWNDRRVNRLEYYLSALERLAYSVDFLPRRKDDLPSALVNMAEDIQERIRALREEIQALLDEMNRRFQELVAAQYTSWLSKGCDIVFTSQFLRRCLKPNWDPETEKAVVFIFDGMRYDVWDELLRPIFEDRMEVIAEYLASSLLPTETHVSRKALCAGTFPDDFNMRSGEDRLLKDAMHREFGYDGDVEVIAPEGLGTGETVRYRAGNLDVYIFELCDRELHKIQVKKLPDGRQAPGRPLAFIYRQHIKNIVDIEVMAIIRSLDPDTKVFVAADHGFGSVGRERIGLEASWLNEPEDCFYQNAWLRQSLSDADVPRKVSQNTLEFPVEDLRLPAVQDAYDRKTSRNWQKTYSTIIFPKTGYALARPRSRFNPDAYSHGGISVQEMLVPMIAMRVRSTEEGLLIPGAISGPTDVIEGEEAEFRMPVQLTESHKAREIRIESQATYQRNENATPPPHQVQYISGGGGEVVYRFVPDADDASEEERRNGAMERTLSIGVTYREGARSIRKSRTVTFCVHLNPEKIVRRVPAHLGKILGLRPRSMK